MKLKKIGAVLLACSFIFLLACQKQEQAAKAQTNQEQTQTTNSEGYQVATIDDVNAYLKNENAVVVDARNNDSYIGWALNSDKRGGHIDGATDFSASWLTSEYDDKENLEQETRETVLKAALKNKNITADKKVIVYDTNDTDAKKVADYFKQNGINDVKLFNASEYIADEKNPMSSYKNYEMLIAAPILKDLIDGNDVESIKDKKNVVIVDVRWGDNENSGYLDGHIKGSVHINTDSFEPPTVYVDGIEEWRLADDDTLVKLLLDNGIDKDTTLISTSPEPMAAARFAFIAKYLGVEDVRVLNGGLTNWKSYGYELDTTEEKPVAKTDFLAKYPKNPNMLVSTAQVKESLGKDDFTLLDARTWEEHIGETSGYSYHNKKGRIDGSIYLPTGKVSSSSVSYFRNIDKTIRNADEIKNMLVENKIDTSKELTLMCGSGWRVAEILWDLNVIGIENVNMYSDGWIAWSNEGNPFVTGEDK